MRRREVLKNLAAGSTAGVGVGALTGTAGATHAPPEKLDALYVKRDGETVREIPNPSAGDIASIEANLGSDEQLVTEDDDCYIYCRSDYCPCESCAYACSCLSCSECC